MNITLAGGQQKKARRKPSPLERRFAKLRDRVQRETRGKQRFEADMDVLVRAFHDGQQEVDRKHLDVLRAVVEKLIIFAGRKSLADWQRTELADWVFELLQRIGGVAPDAQLELARNYAEAVARSMGLSRQELEAQLSRARSAGRDSQDPPGTHRKGGDHADTDDIPEQDDLFGFDFDLDEPFEGPDPFTGDFSDELVAAADVAARTFDADWLKRLFRRAAHQLHPDRERDPEARKGKEARMRALLEARDQGDVLGLLNLYGEAMGETSLALAEDQLETICLSLEQQLAELEEHRLEFLYEHPDRLFVYDLLYSPHRQQREANLKDFQRQLRSEGPQLRRLLERLRNLAVLRELLGERRDIRIHVRSLADFEDW